jgi:hypothetical protein
MDSLDKKLAVAAVAASLGLSLGVPVGDALAADDPAGPAVQVSSDPAKSAIESKRGKFRPNKDKAESTGSTRMESINRWMEQRPGPGATGPRLEEPRNPATPRRTCPRRGR